MKKHIYRITFLTKKGGERHWVCEMDADTCEEAIEKAQYLWASWFKTPMFQVSVEHVKGDKVEFNNQVFREVKM